MSDNHLQIRLKTGQRHGHLIIKRILGTENHPPGMPELAISHRTVWYLGECGCGAEVIFPQSRMNRKRGCNTCSSKPLGLETIEPLPRELDFARISMPAVKEVTE